MSIQVRLDNEIALIQDVAVSLLTEHNNQNRK